VIVQDFLPDAPGVFVGFDPDLARFTAQVARPDLSPTNGRFVNRYRHSIFPFSSFDKIEHLCYTFIRLTNLGVCHYLQGKAGQDKIVARRGEASASRVMARQGLASLGKGKADY